MEFPTVKVSTFITGPVDLLKMDIEGAEVDVLQEAEAKLPQVKEIMMEFHNNPSNPANSFTTALAILQRQGFNVEVRENNQVVNPRSLNVGNNFYATIIAKR